MKNSETKTKVLQGEIISLTSGKDTAKVEVERKYRHPRYEKLIKSHTKFLVHLPEKNKENFELGQMVKIAEAKSYSKSKSWIIISKPKKK